MKNNVTPIVCAEYNEETDAFEVEVQLPGAHKEDVDLKVLPGGFMIRAPRADVVNTEYIGSYAFCCPVDEDKVSASFDNGLLKAQFKVREPFDKATKVSIE